MATESVLGTQVDNQEQVGDQELHQETGMADQASDAFDSDEQTTGPSPGNMLREGREAAGLSLLDVAEALYLTVHYVKALECDDYAKLPGLTFVKGYCRTYARYLHMDVDAVLASYEAHLRERQDLVAEQEQDFRIRRRNDQAVMWAIAAGIVLVIALSAGWWLFGRESGQQSAALSTALPMYAAPQVYA